MNNNWCPPFSIFVLLAIASLAIGVLTADTAIAQGERREQTEQAGATRGSVQGRPTSRGNKLQMTGSPVDGKITIRSEKSKNKAPRSKQPKKDKQSDIEFPDDNELPLLVMDISGGFLVSKADFTPLPSVRIYPDGRVKTGTKSPKVVPVEGQVPIERIEELISFAVNECKFYEISPEKLNQAMDATGKKVSMMDAGTTAFEMNLKNLGINAVDVYALPYSAKRFHEVSDLASLVKLQAKCKQLMAEVNLGSPEEAASVVQFTNIGLRNESDVAPEFTLEHLQYAERFVDGKRTAMFSQTFNSRKHGPQVAVATYTESSKGVPDIVVRVDAN